MTALLTGIEVFVGAGLIAATILGFYILKPVGGEPHSLMKKEPVATVIATTLVASLAFGAALVIDSLFKMAA